MDTQSIAILGAVTGIIGTLTGFVNLYFRYKQHKKDSRNLSCKLSLKMEFYEEEIFVDHQLEVVSLGKRNVELDYFTIYYKPPTFLQKFRKRSLWRKNRYCHTVTTPFSTLTDGEKKNISLNGFKVENYNLIEKIRIFDKTGEKWKVKLIPKTLYSKRVKNEFYEKKELEKEDRKVTVQTYCMDREYVLSALFITTIGDKKATQPIIKKFDNLKELDNYKANFIERCQNDYLTGKIKGVELARL